MSFSTRILKACLMFVVGILLAMTAGCSSTPCVIIRPGDDLNPRVDSKQATQVNVKLLVFNIAANEDPLKKQTFSEVWGWNPEKDKEALVKDQSCLEIHGPWTVKTRQSDPRNGLHCCDHCSEVDSTTSTKRIKWPEKWSHVVLVANFSKPASAPEKEDRNWYKSLTKENLSEGWQFKVDRYTVTAVHPKSEPAIRTGSGSATESAR